MISLSRLLKSNIPTTTTKEVVDGKIIVREIVTKDTVVSEKVIILDEKVAEIDSKIAELQAEKLQYTKEIK